MILRGDSVSAFMPVVNIEEIAGLLLDVRIK